MINISNNDEFVFLFARFGEALNILQDKLKCKKVFANGIKNDKE